MLGLLRVRDKLLVDVFNSDLCICIARALVARINDIVVHAVRLICKLYNVSGITAVKVAVFLEEGVAFA